MAEETIETPEDGGTCDDTARASVLAGAHPCAGVLFLLIGLVALVGIVIFGLNTGPGKRLVVDQLNKFELASGLGFDVGAIRGSTLRTHDTGRCPGARSEGACS